MIYDFSMQSYTKRLRNKLSLLPIFTTKLNFIGIKSIYNPFSTTSREMNLRNINL